MMPPPALTHLLLHQQRPDQAESLLTAALAKDPDNPTLNAQLASLYEQQGKDRPGHPPRRQTPRRPPRRRRHHPPARPSLQPKRTI